MIPWTRRRCLWRSADETRARCDPTEEAQQEGGIHEGQEKGEATWARLHGVLLRIHPQDRASAAALVVKRLSMQETQVQSLGREDPLQEEMATHSSILAWKIQRQGSPLDYSPWGCKRVGHDLAAKTTSTGQSTVLKRWLYAEPYKYSALQGQRFLFTCIFLICKLPIPESSRMEQQKLFFEFIASWHEKLHRIKTTPFKKKKTLIPGINSFPLELKDFCKIDSMTVDRFFF